MKLLSFHIARRYLFGKKSHNAINIISGISVVGVAISTMAMITILSVYNGLDQLVRDLHKTFYPDLHISVVEGKTFSPDSSIFDDVRKVEGVAYFCEVLEDNALFKYEEKQHIGMVKGVDSVYSEMSFIDTSLRSGVWVLRKRMDTIRNYAVTGYGVAHKLNLNPSFSSPLFVYYPRRDKKISATAIDAFRMLKIAPVGVFMINQPEIDEQYVFVPIEFARDLFGYTNEVSAIEIKIDEDYDEATVQEKIQNILGSGYKVKNRSQQNELLYKILNSEKWAIYAILTFILIISSFNILGSLTMLIFDKRNDILVLRSMGASKNLIRRIFLLEGWLIAIAGAFIGLLFGFALAWTQQEYGLLKLQTGGNYIIQAYPVYIKAWDFVFVLFTVLLIGFLASWYPVRQISKKYLETENLS